MAKSIGKLSLCVKHKIMRLHDVVVEDLLWNSLDGNVSERSANDEFFPHSLIKKGIIGWIKADLCH